MITNIRCTFRQAILGQALGYYVRLHEEICSEYHMSQKIGTKISCILTNRKVFSFRIDLIAQTSSGELTSVYIVNCLSIAVFIERVCVV